MAEFQYIRIEAPTGTELDPGLGLGTTTETIGGEDVSNCHECWNFHAETVAGHEVNTGHATGARSHTPVQFSCRWNKSYPLLQLAIRNNSQCVFEVKMFRTMDAGQREKFVNITYTNCRVVGLRMHTAESSSPVGDGHPVMEVKFVFENMVVNAEGECGGTEGEDTWGTTN